MTGQRLYEVSKGKGGGRGKGKGRRPRYEVPEPRSNVRAEPVEVHKPAMAPPKSAWRSRGGKFALAVGAGGGAAYLYHRHVKDLERQAEATFTKYEAPKEPHRTRAAANVIGGATVGALAGAGAAIPALKLAGNRAARQLKGGALRGAKRTVKGALYTAAALPVAGAAAGAASGSRKNEHLGIGAKSYFGKGDTVKTIHNPFDGRDYEVAKAVTGTGSLEREALRALRREGKTKAVALKGRATDTGRRVGTHIGEHKAGYAIGAGVTGALGVDALGNRTSYRRGKAGEPQGGLGTMYPVAYRYGERKRVMGEVGKAHSLRDATMGTNVSRVSTPSGITGAGNGLALKHVRGKNTTARRTASQHFTNRSASDRRVKSLHFSR